MSWLAKGQVFVYRYGIGMFTSPVHEEITARIWGCEAVGCDDLDSIDVPIGVIAGVRWNDDPRFPLTAAQAKGTSCDSTQSVRAATQPICWAEQFKRAERLAANGRKFGPGDPLLYRTHFGDLQFLHAMGSLEGEMPAETRTKMLEWAEFMWGVSRGQYTIETRLKDVDIGVVRDHFGTTEWRVMDLLTLGNSGIRRNIKDVAFGSLLHMLQDSFAAGHVDREESSGASECSVAGLRSAAPGIIREFHSYAMQNHEAHSRADSREAFLRNLEGDGDVVEVGKVLRQLHEREATWEVVKPYLECAFAISPSARASGAGDAFSL